MLIHRDWLLTPERAVVHLPTATAVVADLHLGYSVARQRTGEAIPEPALTEVLRPLAVLVAREHVERLVIAGDLFEAGWCGTQARRLLDWLRARSLALRGVVPGNHDHRLTANDLLPVRGEGTMLGGWRVLHGDGPLPATRVIHGHDHPWLRWRGASVPCFLCREDRIVLPAFSRDARGVNVLPGERWRGYRCCAIVGNEVLDVGPIEEIPK